MNIKVDNELIENSFSFWSEKNLVPLLACEEMGELIQAVSKVERKMAWELEEDDELRDKVEEEIRDVAICLNLLMIKYGFKEEHLNDMILEKLSRNK